ncbi:MAG: nucleotidyltransferase domain-containing protein [Chloroflexi bacterium]|nr:nucleotidyltransferase domain-containing protein [Chloroflexota bacterium]
MSDSNPQAIAEVVAALRQDLGDDLVAIVLFGSRARDEADETSDWDLLVIARHLPEKFFQRHLQLKAMLPVGWRGQVSLLARTPEEFTASLPALFLDIALDGIVLYDVDNYMAKRLTGLKRLLEKRGLQRERVQHEMVWRWQRFPGFDWALEWEAVT